MLWSCVKTSAWVVSPSPVYTFMKGSLWVCIMVAAQSLHYGVLPWSSLMEPYLHWLLQLLTSIDYLHWLPLLIISIDYLHWLPPLTTFIDYLRWLPVPILITSMDYLHWLPPSIISIDYLRWLPPLITCVLCSIRLMIGRSSRWFSRLPGLPN